MYNAYARVCASVGSTILFVSCVGQVYWTPLLFDMEHQEVTVIQEQLPERRATRSRGLPVQQTHPAGQSDVVSEQPAGLVEQVESQTPKNKNKSKKKSSSSNPRPTVFGLANTVGGLSTAVNCLQESASISSTRTERLEAKMTSFESKMDFLINFVTADKEKQTSTSVSSDNVAPLNVPATSHNRHVPRNDNDSFLVFNSGDDIEHLPPPAVLRREENRRGVIDDMLRREEYQPATGSGKSVKVLNDWAMPHPYMYIEKEGCDTQKEKLDARPGLNSAEYINAMLLLLDDDSAYAPADKQHIFRHIIQVSTDSLTRPWAPVKKWSQYIWDSVERGRCTWQQDGFIQHARIRISYTSGPAPLATVSTSKKVTPQQQEPVYIVCRDFNSSTGCKSNGTHESGTMKYMHVCAYCDAVGRKSSHSVIKCRARGDNANTAYNQFSDNRQWPNQQQRQHNSGGSYGPQQSNNQGYRTSYYNSHAKNG